ncbi:O-antigen ligase family protein [Rubrobacter calidifluminis]|uniref:O-antigen ligase family protein n=1 Tax=Rubrobacter calidifluminis TaxID=1392640 RepID=UPI002360EF56|nr:O-antigen ligase family protein [Rubrobacter calidifluminis]
MFFPGRTGARPGTILALSLLACAGGAGLAFVPAPTFLVVAATFCIGLWLATRGYFQRRGDIAEDAVVGSPPRRSTFAGRLVPVFLVFWWVVLIAPLSLYDPRVVGGQDAAQATASGSLQNQIMIVAFGGIGLILLMGAIKRMDVAFRWILVLWAVYLGWGYASLLWSVYPPLTIRNLVAYVLVTFGSFGLGAGFYGARPDGRAMFFRHITVAGLLSALVILIPLPLHWGQIDPLNPAQRLEINGNFTALVARPVMTAVVTLLITSLVGLRKWRTRDWLYVFVLLLPVFVLKTRGPFLWAMLALVIVYLLYRTRVHDRIFQLGLAVTAALGAYVSYSSGMLGLIVPYLTRDNTQLSMSLTGRIPLWEAIVPQIEQHPLLGVGFAAFWNPENLYRMQEIVGFPVVSAHNGFLQELLDTGMIGLALFLVFWVSTMALVVHRARRGGDRMGWFALALMVLYLLLNVTTALMQEYLEFPFMLVFATLGMMAVRNPSRENDAGIPRPERLELRVGGSGGG